MTKRADQPTPARAEAPEGATDPWADIKPETMTAWPVNRAGGGEDVLAYRAEDVDRAEAQHQQETERLRAEVTRLESLCDGQRESVRENMLALKAAQQEIARLTQERDGWKYSERQALTVVSQQLGELHAVKAERDALTEWWTRVGELLQSGGMNDPAFLVGAIQAEVEARRALTEQVATLREALEQIAAYDELTGREYYERYGRTVYDRPQATIARAALAATEGGTK